MSASTDRIEKQVMINAPRSRVWRAVADAAEFGDWFGVNFKGKTFIAGQPISGKITYPGYEHLTMEVTIERIEPERLLAFRWHPAAIDSTVDYSPETKTLVVFELHEVDGGTLLTVTESGLANLPAARRAEAFRLNSSGWEAQMVNVQKHVEPA